MFRFTPLPFDLQRFNDSAPAPAPAPAPAVQTPPVDFSSLSLEEKKKHPFFQDVLSSVRQQEKDKLYGDISSLKNSLTSLEKEAEAREAARKEAEEKAKREALEAMSLQELMAHKTREYDEKFAEIQRNSQAEIENLRKQNERERLETRRVQLLHTSGLDAKYAQYVTGNSEDEIQRNIEMIKAIRGEVASSTPAPASQTQTVYPPANAGIVNPQNAGSGNLSTDAEIMQALKNKDYNDPNVRAELKRATSQQYKTINN